ncbi:MAG: MBL fold metallo-hydrolase [Archangium sp.]
MTTLTLFEAPGHRNVLVDEPGSADECAEQSNQHLIIHEKSAILLDPSGEQALGKVREQLGNARLESLFLSHQDADIVASVGGWLRSTDAIAWASNLWLRFIPHCGLDGVRLERLKGIPDQGMVLNLSGLQLVVLPAHFLHSPGNFQLYDPVSKILYSGDLGASIVDACDDVKDFEQHRPSMEGFHRRFMASGRSMRAWAKMARTLDIEIIAPQHGRHFKGKAMVDRFISWCEQLECGVDLVDSMYRVPTR